MGYGLEGLLEELLPLLLGLRVQLFNHLNLQMHTSGRFFTRNLLTSDPPWPSNTPNREDFGQF